MKQQVVARLGNIQGQGSLPLLIYWKFQAEDLQEIMDEFLWPHQQLNGG